VRRLLAVSRSRTACFLLAMLLFTVSVRNAHADFIVAGDSNIFGAGLATPPAPAGGGAGELPPSISVAGGSGSYLTFSVSGLVTYNGGGNYWGGDGVAGNLTNLDSVGVISGIEMAAQFPLVGVFLDSQAPAATAPPALDFTSTSFTAISPGLNQVFYIGDGLTGTGVGSQQLFYIPQGATDLYLGFADGNNFVGLPGTYSDDFGSLDVTYTVTATAPAPASLTMLGIGVACLFGYAAWKRVCISTRQQATA
jgi:hypothetical protein